MTMSRQNRRTISNYRHIAVLACTAIMALGLLIGLLFFLRPTTSTIEKRELTAFPTPTLSSFIDGSFFTDVSLWYADTYPLREPMVGAAQSFKNLYGIQPEVKLIGGNFAADEIGAHSDSSSDASDETSGSQKEATTFDEVDAPEAKPMQEAMQEQLMAGLYLKNGAAYNIYYFVDEGVEAYIKAINSLADEVAGEAEVYSVLIPNGGAVLLDKSELDALGGSDQNQAIEYVFGRLSDKVHPVDIRSTLNSHKDEYLFFRTDHHWTQLGAYYAYTKFCEERGFEAQDMQSWESMDFDDFLGTFYSETNDPSLVADTVHAYIPPQTNDMVFTDTDGSETESHVINDVTDWGPGTGYYCYGIGDYPLTHVSNPELTDGSACLLLKDSYGNCFAPELIGHYQDLWVIDYRYSDTDICAFVREHNIDDIIIENNITIASNIQVTQSLLDQVEKGLTGTAEQTVENTEAPADNPTEASDEN